MGALSALRKEKSENSGLARDGKKEPWREREIRGACDAPEYRHRVYCGINTAIVTPLACGFLLCRPGFLAALGADQRQVISGIEWVAVRGLLSGGTQGNVYAPVVGQDHYS